MELWSATPAGETCEFETVADPRAKKGRPPSQLQFEVADREPAEAQPGPSGRRLSNCSIGQKSAAALARELALTRERIGQLLLRLHAHDRTPFVGPDHPAWLIRRADDKRAVLDRDETRVLSAVPVEGAAEVSSLRMVKALARCDVERALDRLIDGGLVEVVGSPSARPAFRLSRAGHEHPQYAPPKRPVPPSRLPVRSDRIRLVLQTIADAGALRIRDVKYETKISQNSINALMQYLKRKKLVAKPGPGFEAPYSLTDQGRLVLNEMALRQAA